MSDPKNGERKLISIVGIIAWRWGVAAAVAYGAYGAMWVKMNAPSREQFYLLTMQVQGVREEMIRWASQREKLESLEKRFEKVDDRLMDLERRASPPPRRPMP